MVTGPVILGNHIAVADGFGYLHWLNRANGKLAARNTLDGSAVYAQPIAHGDRVYVYTSGGNLFAFKI